MLLSIAVLFLSGLLLATVADKLKLPRLVGMLIAGVLIGPSCLNMLASSLLAISSDLRRIALVIILLRAGLTLKLDDLKKVGRPAFLMCFVPACFEILGMYLLGPIFFDLSKVDALLLGSVIAAVSPAVVVPKMIKIIDEGYGTKEAIPQLILAGASVDDVFVIALFSSFLQMSLGNGFDVMSIVNVPISIISGILIGVLIGYVLDFGFKKCSIRASVKVIILIAISLLLCVVENKTNLPFASLLAVMFMGIILRGNESSTQVSGKLNELWVGAEIVLFVLVGASVNITSALDYGVKAIVLVLLVLIFRVIGVAICLLGSSLNLKERIFCMAAYLPKATVQAAIGGLPLASGVASGNLILTISVLSILITAPLGAFLIELLYPRLLNKSE